MDARAKKSRTGPVSKQTRGLQGTLPPVAARPHVGAARMRRLFGSPLYSQMVHELRVKYKICIRKWRTDMVGCAYELTYADGRIKRLISAPRPRSPVSAAIFLHEIGHHAIGFKRYEQRCLEEYYVWQWAFREMLARGIPVTQRVARHYRRSMYYYVRRAHRRGEHVPHELSHFVSWPG